MMPAFFSSNLLPRPPHRLGPGLVRRLPHLHLLLRPARRCWWRSASHVIPYNVAFKLATVLGSVPAAGDRLGLRPAVPARPPGPGRPGGGHPAVPVRLHVHHLRREPLLDPGRGVRLLASASPWPCSSWVWSPGACAPAGTGAGRRWCWPCASLAHIVPAMFALVGAGAPDRLRVAAGPLPPPRRRRSARRRGWPGPPGREGVRGRRPAVWWSVSTVAIGVLLSGWWLVPFGVAPGLLDVDGLPNVTTYVHPPLPRGRPVGAGPGRGGGAGGLVLRSRFGLLVSAAGRPLGRRRRSSTPRAASTTAASCPCGSSASTCWSGGCSPSVRRPAVARWWRRERLARWAGCRGRRPARRRCRGRLGDAAPRPVRHAAPGSVAGPPASRPAAPGAVLVVVPPRSWWWRAAVGLASCPRHHPGANQVDAPGPSGTTAATRARPDYPEYRAVMTTMEQVGQDARLRPGHVGVQRRPEPLRHPRGAHAAAVLDRRVHRLHGGTALRVVDHHPLPLPQPGRAVGRPVRAHGRPALRHASTCRSGSSTSSCSGSATSWPPARGRSRRPRRPASSWWPRSGPWHTSLRRRRRWPPPGTSTRCATRPLVTAADRRAGGAHRGGPRPGQLARARRCRQVAVDGPALPGTTTRPAGRSSWRPAARRPGRG